VKRAFLIVAFSGLIGGGVADALAATKTYTNKTFLYSIDYPETWRARELSNVAMIVAPLESPEDKFSENITIVVEDLSKLPNPPTLIDYHRQSSGGASKRLQDFKMLEEAQTIWHGKDAIIELYTATVRGETFKFKAVKFYSGSSVYILTYTAKASDFEKYESETDKVLKTIRVSP
jgi:hypothetical protein